MFRELDWDKSNKVDIGDHWRLLLCVVVGVLVATPIWHAFFPNTFWFIKLWTGFATGATAGLLPGTWWQLRDENRRSITSGCFVVTGIFAWGLFAGISLFLWVPDLHAQENERSRIRSLSVAEISSISVRVDDEWYRNIQNADLIASFVDHTKQAELFYPSHEGSTVQLQLIIYREDDTPMQYEGRVPEYHPNDFSLNFRGYFVWSEIIIPGGRIWLNSIANQDAR